MRAEKWAVIVPTVDEAEDAFRRIDTDGSGAIGREELAQCLTQELGMELTPAEMEDAFAELDVDGDGQVDVDEFVDGMVSLKNPDSVHLRAMRVIASRAKRRSASGARSLNGTSTVLQRGTRLPFRYVACFVPQPLPLLVMQIPFLNKTDALLCAMLSPQQGAAVPLVSLAQTK